MGVHVVIHGALLLGAGSYINVDCGLKQAFIIDGDEYAGVFF